MTSRNLYRKVAIWVVAAMLMLPGIALAQGRIAGVVMVTYPQPLPGVTIEVNSPALNGVQRSEITDEEGRFTFEDLPFGTYSLKFMHSGFETIEREVKLGTREESAYVEVELEEYPPMAGGDPPMAGGYPPTAGGGPPDLEELMVVGSRGPQWNDEIQFRMNTIGQREFEEGEQPIRFLGQAAYAFNTPPGLQYLEEEELLFRVDPTRTALEAKEDVEALGLRGSIEATTGLWSRCMEAELIETTIDSKLRAHPVDTAKLRILPLVWDPNREQWLETKGGNRITLHKMGRHPTDWKWRITGIKPGRTQLVLRLHAVRVLKDSELGKPICTPLESRGVNDSRRIQTFQRRMVIEISTVSWIEAKLPSPFLWSLLLPLIGLVLAWWRRIHAQKVLADS